MTQTTTEATTKVIGILATTKMLRKAVRTTGCPACCHTLAFPVTGHTRIYDCALCNALFGDCYLGESYELVLPYWRRRHETEFKAR